MTSVIFLVFRAFFISMMTVGMMASLTEFRFGRWKLLSIMAVYSVWVVASSAVLLWFGGELLLLRVFYLTISVPAILLTYWAANDSPAQAVFNYTTQIMVSVLSASMIRWLTDSLGLSAVANILLMCAFYFTAIYLEWRFLRQPFRMLIQIIPARWGVLTLIPCVFCIYLILVSAWPTSYLENFPQRVYVYTAIIPLVFVYVAVFKSLVAQYNIQMERQSAALLTVQITALKTKLQSIKEVEGAIRIQRHDLRHQLQAVAELVAQGNQQSALDFLDTAQRHLDEQKEIRWCHPPILDAVFSSYFDQAKNQDILVKAKISLPDTLTVDEGALAIVVANALENAIHANQALPQDQRVIRCKMVGTPSIMLQISNPCDGEVTFDAHGLPIAHSEGHGLGVQSISAFCQKHGAVFQFELKDGWFRFRLVL